MGKSKKPAIENAAEIIEKFGGIRPMSAKINIAVTTIQGWKKRNAIPASRKKAILDCAANNNIDLSEFFPDAPVVNNQSKPEEGVENGAKANAQSQSQDNVVKDITSKPAKKTTPESSADSSSEPEVKASIVVDDAANKNKVILESNDEFSASSQGSNSDRFTEIVYDVEKKAITKSVLIAAAMVLIIIGAIVVMLLPDFKEKDKRIAKLESSISEISNRQSEFKGLVPENWSEQLNELKQQVANAKHSMDKGLENVQAASKEFIEANSLEERAIKLQTYVSEIANESGIYGLLSRFDDMSNSSSGQQMLESSVLELSKLFSGAKNTDESYINGMLNSARSQSQALQATLGSVPQQELKAAAMLLAMTQVRSALNRDNAAFDSDLNLLMNMVGDDNPELKASLEKLAPQSKSGVLSIDGLQKEFRSVAGDVVAASLQGDDVSFSQKASARMNEILKIEKDGELITGTKTQNTIQKADKMLSNGNLDGAMKYLNKNLNTKELKPLEPFIKKLETAITVDKVKKAIEQAIELNAGSGYLGGKQLLKEE